MLNKKNKEIVKSVKHESKLMKQIQERELAESLEKEEINRRYFTTKIINLEIKCFFMQDWYLRRILLRYL